MGRDEEGEEGIGEGGKSGGRRNRGEDRRGGREERGREGKRRKKLAHQRTLVKANTATKVSCSPELLTKGSKLISRSSVQRGGLECVKL